MPQQQSLALYDPARAVRYPASPLSLHVLSHCALRCRSLRARALPSTRPLASPLSSVPPPACLPGKPQSRPNCIPPAAPTASPLRHAPFTTQPASRLSAAVYLQAGRRSATWHRRCRRAVTPGTQRLLPLALHPPGTVSALAAPCSCSCSCSCSGPSGLCPCCCCGGARASRTGHDRRRHGSREDPGGKGGRAG